MRLILIVPVAGVAALVVASAAFAHARISPPVSVSGELQLYNLAVPTEKEDVTTTKVVLTVPEGFSVDSFVASPGWHRSVESTGTGEDTVIQKVTWTGGNTPTEEDSLFQFLGEASSSGNYTFGVQQTYSDGSIVDWTGAQDSENPAVIIEARSSLGGGGSSTLAIIALVVGAVGVILGAVALFAGGGGRQLA